jgi:hypothetical protein
MNPSLVVVALVLASLRAAAADPQPLTWDASVMNEGLTKVRAARGKPKGALDAELVVPVTVVVLDGAKADAGRAAFDLEVANEIYNGFDAFAKGDALTRKSGTTACGIVYEFKGARKVSDPGLRQELLHYDELASNKPSLGYYDNTFRLSAEEMAILDAVGPAPDGGVQLVYIKGLDRGHGYTYNLYSLRTALDHMKADALLPAGKTVEQLYFAYERNILLSDVASPDTAAHELGHAVGNLTHEKDGDNLMRGGGGGDGVLADWQCSRLRSRVRRGLKTTLSPSLP